MRKGYIIVIFLFIYPAFAANDFYREQVKKRIQPIGKVRINGEQTQTAPVPEATEQKEVAKKEPGAEIYDQFCKTCHQSGLAGAPKFRNKEDWKPRLQANNMEQLVANAIKGINAMPPKGTCSSCSDDDIRLAVEYMVPKS